MLRISLKVLHKWFKTFLHFWIGNSDFRPTFSETNRVDSEKEETGKEKY